MGLPSRVDVTASRRALFLDRDGVVNADHGYVHRTDQFDFVDGVFELCRAAAERGYLLVIVTNQSGIGRGYYSQGDFDELTRWMRIEFAARGIVIDGVYSCPYHPRHGKGPFRRESDCRKPQPGMLLKAAQELGIDLAASVLVGDKASDIGAGVSAGVGCNLLYTGVGSSRSKEPAAHGTTAVIARLFEAHRFLAAG